MARRERVTRRYPEHDWSGIAMLTQQLSSLFEPSKAKLMDKQQEHEMRMLEAKQAWKFGEERLETNKALYTQALKDIESYEEKLAPYGADVLNASLKEGALPENASKIHEETDIRKLSDMNDLANSYHQELINTQKKLNEMKEMNFHALSGKNWSNTLEASPTEKREDVKGKNYKAIHDADRSGTLSWSEQGNALKDYINDYYQPAEGEEGITINIGGEDMAVAPEALAFKAGFEHVRGRKKVDATDASAQISKLKTPQQYLDIMYQARSTIQNYEQGGMNIEELKFLAGEVPEGYTSADVDIFTSSHQLFKEAYKAYIKKGEIIPDDLRGVAPVSLDMFTVEGTLWGENATKFANEGLDYEKYKEIQRSDNDIYKKMAFNIVYNWEDIMKSGGDAEKANMLKSFELLKKVYEF